jgi:thymidylate synthase
LDILNVHQNIEDYTVDDFKLNNYQYHENINLIMRE